MSVWRRGVHSKVADFIGLVNSEWYNQHKVGNIDIIVLRKVCDFYDFLLSAKREVELDLGWAVVAAIRGFS